MNGVVLLGGASGGGVNSLNLLHFLAIVIQRNESKNWYMKEMGGTGMSRVSCP